MSGDAYCSTGDELDLASLMRNGLNLAVMHAFDVADEEGRITWITEGSVRIAAIVPVELVPQEQEAGS